MTLHRGPSLYHRYFLLQWLRSDAAPVLTGRGRGRSRISERGVEGSELKRGSAGLRDFLIDTNLGSKGQALVFGRLRNGLPFDASAIAARCGDRRALSCLPPPPDSRATPFATDDDYERMLARRQRDEGAAPGWRRARRPPTQQRVRSRQRRQWLERRARPRPDLVEGVHQFGGIGSGAEDDDQNPASFR